ncbi:FAD-binding protein [Mangrovicoccus sp. HB161399]|uniref:FAD-binding protein n=1 Tax=Mangrovicoccus sp. HB161399 TaxID=2720392 RepID=UPI001556E4B5|nr:FAD-binding protein [Mangrovicoccus sp. HB161399]
MLPEAFPDPDAPLPERCELLVVGTGAAGMAAALRAEACGLHPILVDKAPVWGGSTAVSGGAIWVPDNPLMRRAGMADDRAAARAYLQSEAGNLFNAELVDAFLSQGPEAIAFFNDETELTLSHRPVSPDYHSDRYGAAEGGRALDAHDFDGRKLGPMLARMKPPIEDFTILGGLTLGRPDIYHFLRMTRSAVSARYAAGRILRYGIDRLGHGRNTRLVMGAAVAARLASSAFARGIPMHLGQELVALERNASGRVTGAQLRCGGVIRRITASHGVVLAAGGFPHDAARRARTFDHVRRGLPHYSMSPASGTGGAIAAAEAIGAAFVESNSNAAFWTPVSLLKNRDGSTRPFPHLFLDRAKPGVIAVGHDGQRFVNEAVSYHDFVQALIGKLLDGGQRSAWLVCDHRALRRYGLGAVPAFPGRIAPHLASGYLKRGATLAELAGNCGIDPAALSQTIERFNRDAASGTDSEFGKGTTSYQRYLGDPECKPNPCLRPLVGPLYAVEIFPGDIGTSMGLEIDAQGRVKDREGQPIEGLFACGNDINSIMSGAYPGAGITLGPALTFGYIVGNSAAELPAA